MFAITRWHWALAIGFWIFLAAVYVAQVLWIAQSERINLGAALTLQLSYYAAWVPATMVIWRFTAGWVPDTAAAWRRIVVRHVLIFVIVLVVVTLVTTAVVFPLVQIPGGPSPSQAFWMQIRGRGYLTLLMYIIVAGGGTAMTLQDRYRERQAAAAALQHELATARLQALRNHLEPHFLFNSLHSIAALARANDIAGVVRLCRRGMADGEGGPTSHNPRYAILVLSRPCGPALGTARHEPIYRRAQAWVCRRRHVESSARMVATGLRESSHRPRDFTRKPRPRARVFVNTPTTIRQRP